MKKKTKAPKSCGITFIIIGALLMSSALLLFIYNKYDAYRAEQAAKSILSDIQASIDDEEEIYAADADMSAVMIDGYEYIGYLTFPELELSLPVMADWDYTRLKLSPCRHFGTPEADDLVIAAHNYRTHFGRLSSLDIGTEIIFTDMNGTENRYAVQKLDTLAPDAVASVQDSGYALVLYTCTSSGNARTAVFCSRLT